MNIEESYKKISEVKAFGFYKSKPSLKQFLVSAVGLLMAILLFPLRLSFVPVMVSLFLAFKFINVENKRFMFAYKRLMLLMIFGIHTKDEYSSAFNEDKGCFVSNHVSFIDGLILGFLYDFQIIHGRTPFAYKIMDFLKMLPRTHVAKINLIEAVGEISSSARILYFPEAHMVQTKGVILPFIVELSKNVRQTHAIQVDYSTPFCENFNILPRFDQYPSKVFKKEGSRKLYYDFCNVFFAIFMHPFILVRVKYIGSISHDSDTKKLRALVENLYLARGFSRSKIKTNEVVMCMRQIFQGSY